MSLANCTCAMHHEIRPQKASSSDPPTTGSSGDPKVTDPRSLASRFRASRRLKRRPCHRCTRIAAAATVHERTLPCPTRQDETPHSRIAVSHLLRLRPKQPANPGNTAGPVLPHRPSETPPVLRNHREGLVTCSTVATCTEKTTPVGSLVTQRKHRRFRTPHPGCSHLSAARGNVRSLAWAAAVVARVTHTVCDALRASASPGSSACRAGAGARLHAANDAEARWWHWQVTERSRRACPPVPGRTVRRTAAQPRDPPRRARRGAGQLGPGTARLPVRRRPLMAAGRPHGPNDPSLMSSLETAVRKARRPGRPSWPGTGAGSSASSPPSPCLPGSSRANGGLLVLAVAAGAGLAASAAVLLCWPPARQWCIARAWCLITPHRVRAGCVNAWVQTRSGRLPFILATTPAPTASRCGSGSAPASPPPTCTPPGTCSRPPAGRRRCASSRAPGTRTWSPSK